MRPIVKGFLIGALGLAVLFGVPAVSLAGPPPTPVATFCECTCWYSGAGGKAASKGVTFTTDRSCSIYNGQTCYCDGQTCYWKYNAGAWYKGELQACKKHIPPMMQGEPPAPVPPGVVKPPGGQGPAVR